jgi:hypothetical protein
MLTQSVSLGTLYRAAGFALARVNEDGIETYWKPLDALEADADQVVRRRSAQDAQAKRYRATRAQRYRQERLF